MIEQARSNEEKASAILALYNRLKDQVVEITHSQYAVRALDALFEFPAFNATSLIKDVDIPDPTARRILRIFRDEGLLDTIVQGRGRRTGVYAFRELLDIVGEAESA